MVRRSAPDTQFLGLADLMSGMFLILLVLLLQALSDRGREDAVRTSTNSAASVIQREGGSTRALVEVIGPGYIRISFGHSSFESGQVDPVADVAGELEGIGTQVARCLGGLGGAATSDVPVPSAPCVAVSVQAHSDTVQVREGTKRFNNNLELSALRAIAVEEQILRGARRTPGFDEAIWNRSVRISGYGSRRPLSGLSGDARENRRIWIDLQWRWYASGCEAAPELFSVGRARGLETDPASIADFYSHAMELTMQEPQ